MSDEYDDIPLEEEPVEEQEQEATGAPTGRFERLLGEDSRKFKLSGMFKDWYLDYASYTILYRAVPHIVDGLKPVQRRVLHTMNEMDDGRYTKVANIVGQAMQYHPHGDASILGALVTIGQKGLLVDCQGNWGNILTGDANAAPRYIEARLSKFAKEVVFDKKVTPWMTSYDGRNQEPTELPVRFPLLLAQGTEGIAAGLSSKILPHNFNELLDGSVAILKGEPYDLYPDFPTGGFADCSKYMDGRRGGTVKVRARIEKLDKNTIAITEIPYGKTSHLVIDSILKAKDKGKIKIKKVEDMTTDKVEILIHLPNDVSPDKTIDALYAFTDCETSLAPNACVIVEGKPQFLSCKDILEYDTFHTRDILGRQLQIRLDELESDWHYNSLEKIFFQYRIYKVLEQNQLTWELQLQEVFEAMKAYQSQVRRPIEMDDILKLVEKPVRKISKFDVKAVDEKIRAIEAEMRQVRDHLEHLTAYTIEWFRSLKKKYGKDFPRRTELTGFETIAATKVINNNAKLYANLATGFVGIGLKKDDAGEYIADCSDISEVIVIGKDGKYRVTKVSDKAFFGENLLYVGVFHRGDSRTIYNVIYRDGKGGIYYAKRFNITAIKADNEYDITLGTPGSAINWFTVNHNGEAETVRIYLRPKPKLKKTTLEYDFSTLAIKSRTSRGNLVSKNPIQRIQLKSKGISTIGGKDIWYDADVQRLNEDGRGLHLGEFGAEDKILAIFRDGTCYTTSFDLSNRYQGEVLHIGKWDPDRIWTALYWDNAAKAFYIKRFSFPLSDNTPVSMIAESKGSYLVALSDDLHPQVRVTFGGKYAHRESEVIDAEQFIGKKGITAKGKKCHAYDLEKVEFIEPRHDPQDEPEEPQWDEEPLAGETASPDEMTENTVEVAEAAPEVVEAVEEPAAEPEMTTEPEPAGDNPGDSPEDLPEAEEVIDAADILGETSYEVDAGPVIPEAPEGNVAETPEAIIPETEGATTLLPAEEEKPSPRKPRKPRTPKSAGKGAQAGDVIDLGADDIPDDEPTLFDLL